MLFSEQGFPNSIKMWWWGGPANPVLRKDP